MSRRDPIAMMLDIAEHFMSQAAELDQRVTAAVEANASHGDIVALMNLAATDRLRALTAAQAAAPFCSPKLQAIEVSPAAADTQSRFEHRLTAMSEDDVLAHLRKIAAGTLTIDALDAERETLDVEAEEIDAASH
jgi:hypothetical protein